MSWVFDFLTGADFHASEGEIDDISSSLSRAKRWQPLGEPATRLGDTGDRFSGRRTTTTSMRRITDPRRIKD
jgi:hypothetical protein